MALSEAFLHLTLAEKRGNIGEEAEILSRVNTHAHKHRRLSVSTVSLFLRLNGANTSSRRSYRSVPYTSCAQTAFDIRRNINFREIRIAGERLEAFVAPCGVVLEQYFPR